MQGETLEISTAKSIEDCVQQCRVKKPDCTAVTYLIYTKDDDNLCILFKTCPSVDTTGVGNSTKLDCSQSRKYQSHCSELFLWNNKNISLFIAHRRAP